MKKILTLSILAFTAFACSKNNDRVVADENLNGSWTMTVYVAFMPALPELNPGDVVWRFDVANEKLHIQNQVAAAYPFLHPTGSYEISLTAETVTIDAIVYDYFFQDGRLIIQDHPELDGPVMVFER
jgi:hypothetical protein